ncbi:hypothetical protein JSQ81_03215 [Sporosarcina sp. Marseille-Q4063]|uniref:hypothetical protein n=1 Tax=Sporosarcina sp. Marseille-Q4063 TaxID=2810514 RepID=UPI001BB03F85|nr:hypothetical protein [Sporosarcina sp. Marseille-Q4063]QUW22609.1 hypothetical protein JSQ81_03215 [Sporosarcina sp. Marseille-Q4063]
MKKIIFGLSIILAGIVLFFVQDPLEMSKTGNGIDKTLFSSENQVFNDAQDKFTVYGMGLSQEEKKMTVRIKEAQYKELVESYFKDLLDSHSMKNYELEVFADELSFHEKNNDL